MRTVAALVLGALFLAPEALLAKADDEAPVATTPHFEFYSDFATNLHDALIVAGGARKDGKPELFQSGPEGESCLGELPSSARAGWKLAVDYYAEVISPTRWIARQQLLVRLDLGGFDDELDERALQFTGIAEGFRMAAAPAYEACEWTKQDAENRRWIDALAGRLAVHESAIAQRLVEVYRTPWRGLPIRVDVVATAPPLGANTLHTPPHILVSTSTEDDDALEIIHHEASHTLMRREDPVQRALSEASGELALELPRDLWHVVLFSTTGDAVRRTLEEAGETGYTPFIDAHDLWDGGWGRYRDALESTWPAYLSGKRTLSQAASDLLRALHSQPGDSAR